MNVIDSNFCEDFDEANLKRKLNLARDVPSDRHCGQRSNETPGESLEDTAHMRLLNWRRTIMFFIDASFDILAIDADGLVR